MFQKLARGFDAAPGQLLKHFRYKKAVKIAVETAARTRTLLVSHEDGKVKMVKPTVKYLGYAPIAPPKKKKAAPRRSSHPKK